MISTLAVVICLNLLTCEMMAECFIWMKGRKARFVDWFVTWMIFSIASLSLGVNAAQWITTNLRG